jgi:uncharacterized protein (TIGR00255 family)
MGVSSMTGFAAVEGVAAGAGWRWEARSVNARGLDLRFRLPEGREALEPGLRRLAAGALRRGAVTAQLRIETADRAAAPRLDPGALGAAVTAARAAAEALTAAGVATAPVAPERLLALRGVFDAPRAAAEDADREATDAALVAGFERALAGLRAARAAEGAALAAALSAALDRIEETVAAAEAAHAAQAAEAPARLRARLAELMREAATLGEDRLAQELALLAIRHDVREELDRLRAHVAAARALLAGDGPAGRELDFLTQEFAREANTLCAKAASAELTRAGLALKVLVDQLREQAQNVE